MIDGVSWRILLDDLGRVLDDLRNGAAPRLPRKTTPMKGWAETLLDHAGSVSALSTLHRWSRVGQADVPPLPRDLPGTEHLRGRARTLVRRIGREVTRDLLERSSQAYRTRIDEILLTALAKAFIPWTGSRMLRVDLESHGREESFEGVDTSRTVGWCTAIYPVLIDLSNAVGPANALKAVKEQLREIPRRGIDYGLLRYAGPEVVVRTLAEGTAPEVVFNYLGQLDGLSRGDGPLRYTGGTLGPEQSPAGERAHLLEINAAVVDGTLRMEWSYGGEIHREATVKRLADEMVAALERLVAHCLEPDAGGLTPADFPLAQLEQEHLDALWEEPLAVEDVYPPSPLQQGMLFHSLDHPGAYHTQFAFRLRGTLDPAAFTHAWRRLNRRHTVLRTAFRWRGLPEPHQIVFAGLDPTPLCVDLCGLPADARQRAQNQLLAADRKAGFDLSNPLLYRVLLLREESDVWHTVFSHHHTLLDGWSFPVLLEELFAFYREALSGRWRRHPQPRRFRDYIAALAERDPHAAEPWFRKTLGGFLQPTPLPEDGLAPRPTAGYHELRQQVSADITAELMAFCRRHHLTMNALLMGAWALLLTRSSRLTEAVFGTTLSGRSLALPGIEKLVGLLINTLPARVSVPGGERLVPWLQDLQHRLATLQEYETVPLVEAQRASDVPPGSPLFESLLVFQNYPLDVDIEHRLSAGLDLTLSGFRSLEQASYPLTLAIFQSEDLDLRLIYDRNRFGGDAGRRILAHFRTLLGAFPHHGAESLAAIPMLTPGERQQLIVCVNDTASHYPRDLDLVRQFLHRVELDGERTALEMGGEPVSYNELARRAAHLAGHLKRAGVVPGEVVGLFAQPSAVQIFHPGVGLG